MPDVVLGFMLLRKLKMEPNQESMILTATGGKMDIKDVITHVRAIFPEGKGTSPNKEVFEVTADASSSETGHAETIEDVLEVITDPLQGSGDEEEASPMSCGRCLMPSLPRRSTGGAVWTCRKMASQILMRLATSKTWRRGEKRSRPQWQ